ncbi:unnamed protein product [Amoebophrya sp. A120]|nr:unnamed protein product [Amoebophrya sp. A120]|eukprot:GSA120T00009572001.1
MLKSAPLRKQTPTSKRSHKRNADPEAGPERGNPAEESPTHSDDTDPENPTVGKQSSGVSTTVASKRSFRSLALGGRSRVLGRLFGAGAATRDWDDDEDEDDAQTNKRLSQNSTDEYSAINFHSSRAMQTIRSLTPSVVQDVGTSTEMLLRETFLSGAHMIKNVFPLVQKQSHVMLSNNVCVVVSNLPANIGRRKSGGSVGRVPGSGGTASTKVKRSKSLRKRTKSRKSNAFDTTSTFGGDKTGIDTAAPDLGDCGGVDFSPRSAGDAVLAPTDPHADTSTKEKDAEDTSTIFSGLSKSAHLRSGRWARTTVGAGSNSSADLNGGATSSRGAGSSSPLRRNNQRTRTEVFTEKLKQTVLTGSKTAKERKKRDEERAAGDQSVGLHVTTSRKSGRASIGLGLLAKPNEESAKLPGAGATPNSASAATGSAHSQRATSSFDFFGSLSTGRFKRNSTLAAGSTDDLVSAPDGKSERDAQVEVPKQDDEEESLDPVLPKITERSEAPDVAGKKTFGPAAKEATKDNEKNKLGIPGGGGQQQLRVGFRFSLVSSISKQSFRPSVTKQETTDSAAGGVTSAALFSPSKFNATKAVRALDVNATDAFSAMTKANSLIKTLAGFQTDKRFFALRGTNAKMNAATRGKMRSQNPVIDEMLEEMNLEVSAAHVAVVEDICDAFQLRVFLRYMARYIVKLMTCFAFLATPTVASLTPTKYLPGFNEYYDSHASSVENKNSRQTIFFGTDSRTTFLLMVCTFLVLDSLEAVFLLSQVLLKFTNKPKEKIKKYNAILANKPLRWSCTTFLVYALMDVFQTRWDPWSQRLWEEEIGVEGNTGGGIGEVKPSGQGLMAMLFQACEEDIFSLF